MPLSDRTKGRWRDAWGRVDDSHVESLRNVIDWAAEHLRPIASIADEAGVHEYDVRNFLKRNMKTRPRHGAGLRLLWFATRLRQDTAPKPREILEQIEELNAVASGLSTFEPDTDYFFRHLQRLGVADEADCKLICDQISGQYFSYRLSRNREMIIRSDYEFLKFSPYNRLPHFFTRLRYGIEGDPKAVERTAEGQIVRIADTFVLIGFVYRGFSRGVSRSRSKVEYEGIQINILPAGQIVFGSSDRIDGLFLSYVYNERYEMGRMKLIRKSAGKRNTSFESSEIGEFTYRQTRDLEPSINPKELELDVSQYLSDVDGVAMLSACLSFVMTREHLSLS